MVKNEALVIQQTLQPLVDGGIKDFVIFDTGSTDGTQEIVKEFFRKHNLINTHVLEEPFIDFGTSRSHALDAAQHLFPEATFMLMLDAEWYMHNAEDLLTFCAAHKDDGHDSYFLSIRSDRLAFYVTRLIRCQRGIRFVGAVHEALNRLTAAMVPDTIYFEWRPSRKGNEKSAQRWQRDRDLLLKSYAENPFDARTLFYLGQTYECLGDWENAYTFYTKRAEINGWDQENFMTRMRLGDVAQHRALQDEVGMCPLVIRHYLEAFSLRPHRAEPLIKIAHYYVQRNEMQLAFLCAVRAVQIPYPANDVLFVEKYLYDFVRYDILGRCAWYVGEYELGEWAVRKALAVHPEAAYLQRNLTFYIDRKNSNHE
jgi:glycosyltransferase involved in cell wall biosynthesis